MERIPDLVARIESGADGAREEARALVTEVLSFHREALARLVESIPGDALAEAARDPLVASLLDLHDIETAAPAALLPVASLVRRAKKTTPHAEATCELCGTSAVGRHAHLVDVATNAILCACLPCAMRFPANGTTYAAVPENTRPADDLRGDDAWWQSLGVPAGVAFFVPRSNGPPRAIYPGAVGAMEANVPAEAWEHAVRAYPVLGTIAPHVEALLVDRADGAHEHWIAGVDRCYELVATVRSHWRGFTGGEEVRDARRRFFATLRAEAS